MKQTLEEAAREAAEDCYEMPYNENLINMRIIKEAFEFGVKWQAKQSPWIRAKDQLPPVDEEDISEQSEPVLVKISGHCEPEILVYNKYYHVWDTSDGDDYSCNISDDDLWMPIPSFDEILEANRDVLERIKEIGD